MDGVARGILNHRRLVLALFVALAIVGVLLTFGVRINYNLADYLPQSSNSTVALEEMQREFSGELPNLRVMLPDTGIPQALEVKARLAEIDGVSDVMWLDDIIDILQPLEMADRAAVETYYKDGAALISLAVRAGSEAEVIDEIRETLGGSAAISGDALYTATAQGMAISEVISAALFLVPLVTAILLISLNSWIEPLLFLITIGISVLIGMGTNVFFGSVSFITSSVSPILQFAVSLDYGIFLLHSFAEYRKQTDDVYEAMRLAMKRSFSSVLASATTTVFGFIALVFMRFGIGSDLGLNLTKGIIISFVSVMTLLPALAVGASRLIDKTAHRPFMPPFSGFGGIVSRVRVPALLFVLILIAPTFLAQNKNAFTYGIGDLEPESTAGQDEAKIDGLFGRQSAMVLLLPRGQHAKEAELSKELAGIPHVTGVISYSTAVGKEIPASYIEPGILSQFYSERYSRIILYADTAMEGDEAFSVVEAARSLAAEYYGGDVLSLGKSANLYDIRDVVTSDSLTVNMIAVVAIGLVLLVTFRSLSLPVILLLTIEASIWINLSVPYFIGQSLCYVGFLVINTVQLGATVDYAILYTDHYMAARVLRGPKEAIAETVKGTMGSILTSVTGLAAAGFILQMTSSNTIVSQLGGLLGRGALLSAAMVIFFLPAALTLLDGLILKTTLRKRPYQGGGNAQ